MFHGTRDGDHFLNEGDVQQARHLDPGRTGDGDARVDVTEPPTNVVEGVGEGAADVGMMAVVARVDEVAGGVEDDDLDRLRAGVYADDVASGAGGRFIRTTSGAVASCSRMASGPVASHIRTASGTGTCRIRTASVVRACPGGRVFPRWAHRAEYESGHRASN